MATNSKPMFDTGQIDPALEQQLLSRGMINKINELKTGAASQDNILSGTLSNMGSILYNMTAAPIVSSIKTLGKSIGGALATPSINKYQDEQTKIENDVHQNALNIIKNPTTPPEQKKGALKIIAKSQANPSTQISQEYVQGQPTNKQLYGSAIQLASLAVSGYNPSLNSLTGKLISGTAAKDFEALQGVINSVKAADDARKYGQTASNIIKGAPSFTKRAIATGGFFGGEAVKTDTTENAIKQGLMWGVGGELSLILAGTAFRALGYLSKKAILEPASNAAGRIYDKIKAYADSTPIEQRLADAPNVTDRLLSVIEPKKTLGQKVAGQVVSGVEATKTLPSKLIDRFAPLKTAEESAAQIKGAPLTESERPYLQARTRSSAKGLAEDKYNQFNDTVVAPYKEIENDVKARMVALDALDRSKLATGKVAGGRTETELESDLAQHIQQSQDRGIEPMIQESIDKNNVFHQGILNDLKDAGLIDKKTIDQLKKDHPNYIPHQVVMDTAERAIGPSASANVASTPLKKAVGSERAIEDPYETTVSRLPNIYQKIEDNKIGKSIAENQEKYNVFGDKAYALDTAENQEKRISVLTRLKDLFKSNRADIRTGKTVGGEIKTATKSLIGAENVEFNKTINNLGTKFDDTSKELNALADEAQTMSADLAPKSKINSVLDKAFNREKKIYMLNADLNKQVGKFNALKEADVTKKAQILSDIKLKQSALDAMIDTRKGIISDLKTELADAKKQRKPLEEETINFYRNGKKETWVVPKDVAVAVKNLDAERSNKLFQAIVYPTKILRAFSTKYNLPFSLQNLARDKQTQVVTAKAFIEDLAQKAGVTPKDINLTDKEILSLYKRSGGIGGTVFDEGVTGEKLMKQMEDSGFISRFVNNIRPDQLIAKLNEKFEMDTRLSTFRMGLDRGLTPRDAALAARDATVDFEKMGSFMKQLNQLVPFLNARLQGAINVGKSISMNPEHYARTMMYTGVYPTVALYQHNRQFQSYRNIPQNISDNYWVIMTGEADGRDNNGNNIKVPQFITVKKGEAQQLVSIPVEHYLNKMDGISNRSVNKMLQSTLGNFSPVSVGSFDSQNFWLSGASQLGPVANVTVGLGTNVNPYTGQKIIPQSKEGASPYLQYGATTPENLKELGKLMNVSPSQIDFVLNSFGGVPGQVVKTANIAEQKIKGTEKQKSLSGTGFGELTKYPFISTFMREAGESGSPLMQAAQQEKGTAAMSITDRKIINKEKAQEIMDNVQKINGKDEKLKYLQQQFMSPEVKDALKTIAAKRRTTGVLSVSDPAELRASVIYSELNKMKARGDSINVQSDYLTELQKAKIITPDVKSQLAGLNAYVKHIDNLRTITDPTQKAQYIMDSVKSLQNKNVNGSLISQYLVRLQNEGIIDHETRTMMSQIKKSGK